MSTNQKWLKQTTSDSHDSETIARSWITLWFKKFRLLIIRGTSWPRQGEYRRSRLMRRFIHDSHYDSRLVALPVSIKRFFSLPPFTELQETRYDVTYSMKASFSRLPIFLFHEIAPFLGTLFYEKHPFCITRLAFFIISKSLISGHIRWKYHVISIFTSVHDRLNLPFFRAY